MSEIVKYLQGKQTAIAAMAKRLTARQMIQATSIAIHQNAALAKCSKESIYEAVLQAARMGLDCSGLHGHGYLVPYGRKCTFVPGWRGLISIAIRSGTAKTIKANVVFKNDVFDWDEGLTPNLVHKPKIDGPRGELICAYAIAYFESADPQFEVMTREDIDKIAKDSRSDSWRNHFAAMARKSAVRRLCSMLPRSLELDDALDLEIAGEAGRAPSELLRVEEPEALTANPVNTVDDVKKKIRKKRAPKKKKFEITEEPPAAEPDANLGDVIAQNNAALIETIPEDPFTEDDVPF